MVVFVAVPRIATRGQDIDARRVALLFAARGVGGALFGLAIGYAAYPLLAAVDRYQVEILLSLALVIGGYALAVALHVSGPDRHRGRRPADRQPRPRLAMSDTTREHLDRFWELIDEILIAVLFVLIGLELLRLELRPTYVWAALAAIPAVLAARLLSVALATWSRLRREFPPRAIGILTWGGLRGGISVALALSLPAGKYRDAIITVTYVVVLFSILVQGLTIGHIIRNAVAQR